MLYFLVGVASEVRIEKIAKNIECLILKEIHKIIYVFDV
jgi:hypothetical protein